MNKLMKIAVLFLLLLNFTNTTFAQPDLPNIGVITQGGLNIISWKNPYKGGLKSMAVERSNDSVHNFTAIGYVKNLNDAVQSFVDVHPMVGKNWYRLHIVFTSDVDWMSNEQFIGVDSAAIANRKPLPPSDSLQKIINATGGVATVSELKAVEMPKSQYVFANPFTGNVNIEIQDAIEGNYQLIFYDANDKEVLKIPRINDKTVILDKRNFQNTGLYKFRLLKNKEEFDKGYVTIY
jgi:hypothetical protein